ncbi:MAG TPA: Clp protease N-terminal domain-containing protein [Streptosporangiaceae bacterium]
MNELEVADLVIIAARVLDADPADALYAVDIEAAVRALAAARCAGPPEEAAARLLRSLLRDPPFPERNAEIAVAATLQLLSLNGRELRIDRPESLRELVRGLAADTVLLPEATRWFGERMGQGTKARETIMSKRSGRRWGDGGTRQTDEVRRALELAEEEAGELRHNYIGTEHLLLGLLGVPDSAAARALARLGVDADAVRQDVLEIVGRGAEPAASSPPYTPRAKKVLDLSLREARRLGHDRVGPEHVLLGLVREGEGLAAQVLVKNGVDLADISGEVMRALPDSPVRTVALRADLAAFFDDYERLRDEVGRLRDLLRRHGIDPDTGAGRTA